MMKFETINNTLCRMVEPEPLRPESQFPCVVRLIQDDSPMGRYNQSYSEYRYGVRLGCCMLPIIATHIAKNGVVNDIEWDVNRYEIVGYPVVDGSAEWALWQMMQGEKIINANSTFPFILKAARIIRCGDNTSWDIGHWLRVFDDTMGWQLYEEPAYKVGDWVEYKKGKHYQVDSVHDSCCYLSYGKGCGCFSALYSDITRKLSPSEVVIHIGCLSGKVEKAYGEKKGTFILRGLSGQRNVLWLSMLDARTRELVESLLKAQEEK